MKITNLTNGHVAFDSGDEKSVNETIWHYRSTCCGAPLDLVNGALICASCGEDAAGVTHKAAIKERTEEIKAAVEAMPDDVRAQAEAGYYKSMEGMPVAIAHIWDKGGPGPRVVLSVELRR